MARRLWHPVFLKHFKIKLIKASLCETEIIDCLQVKKHVYKDRKETTHVEVGEEDIHHHKYIKDKYNVCKHGHKTGVHEEGGKHSP